MWKLLTCLLPVLCSLISSCYAFAPAFLATSSSRPAKISFLYSARFDSENRKTGTVKWFNTMKGFGFIMPSDGSTDVFVHQTAIQTEGFRSLADGEEVEYCEEVDGQGRKRAISVTGPDGQDVKGAPFRPSPDY